MKLRMMTDPEMVKAPIIESPGFAKKGLSDYHMDLARRCAASCTYCSSNATTPMRTNKARLTTLAREQLGVDIDPTNEPGVSIAWDADEVLRRLDAQLRGKPVAWSAGKVLMVSQLTDAFFGYPLTSGLTRRALDMVLARTSFRIRVLTKSDVVGRAEWIDYFAAHPGRFVVGLSVGTLSDEWARRVELATSTPTARLRALRRLQGAGVPTYGMLCPVFPDVLNRGCEDLDALVTSIRPTLCETVWWEAYNDRDNWRAVQAGYDVGTGGYEWFDAAFGDSNRAECRRVWSHYATRLYTIVHDRAVRDGWASKLAYLLYEDGITQTDAAAFAGLDGVLLQSKARKDGYSPNAAIVALQHAPTHGRVAVVGKHAVAPSAQLTLA